MANENNFGNGEKAPFKASIIVPSRDSASQLARCLMALKGQKTLYPFEIIVVDDGSVDETERILKGFSGINIIKLSGQGPAIARNEGAKSARGEILVFTDADCEPAPNWLENMIKPIISNEYDAIKGSYKTRQKTISARIVQVEFEERYDRLEKAGRTDIIDTHSAAIRRDLFEKAGAFPENFPVPDHEDIALSCQLLRLGARLGFIRSAKVWHQHRSSFSSYLRTRFSRGRWRMRVLAMFGSDGTSPIYVIPNLKFQIFTGGLSLLILPFLFVPKHRKFGILGILSSFFLIAFTSNSTVKVAKRYDPPVAPYIPFYTLAKAYTMLFGVLWGIYLEMRDYFFKHKTNIRV